MTCAGKVFAGWYQQGENDITTAQLCEVSLYFIGVFAIASYI